ncbi:recombinase XerC [Virgibacillus halodenitrificans]|uniref:Recombinase XerC n=1 Tax=Virgibacillus halodenitrificans TaxID=1482 RepID=A0AAC9J0Q4_VIRHA|nr:site-specific integrase [Virgibacillus halodenitrificans]APC48992.1 recombinase XerC [Virgibacillus halodenitrificans]
MASFRKIDGKWEYRVRYKQGDKYKEKSKRGFKTKKEAQLAAAKVETDIEQFGFSENGEEYLDKFILDWLEVYKKPNLKPITYSVQERNVRLNIIPRWGKYRLKQINRTEYQKWLNKLTDKYSEGTIRRIHSIMNSALSSAVHDFNILYSNPIAKSKIPKKDKEEQLKYFTKKELEIFLSHCHPVKKSKYKHSIQYSVLFTLMSRTGLRIGEALALHWSDIEGDKLTINKNLVYPLNSTPYISTPKTKNSTRVIKLDDHVLFMLKRHKTNQKEMYLRYPTYKRPAEDLLFHQQDGRWLRTNVVRDYFKEVCKRAGLTILSPHALRHSHAVHLLESGASIKYVSNRLGHAGIKTTADTYLHITEKIENDAIEMYQQYLN